MSTVIQNKQEKEKKAAAAEERRNREKRRMKELSGGMNGTETPEDEEEAADDIKNMHTLPHRGHTVKGSRSMSPAVGRNGENGHNNIAASMNGRSGSPPRFTGAAAGNTRDSFLNYFFGKEGGLPSAGGINAVGGTAAAAAAGNRHVSHNEPSFSQSIRRGEARHVERVPSTQPAQNQDDYEIARSSPGYNDYDSQFVRSEPLPLPT